MIKTVQLFKALADETRLRIISLLLTDGELCVCDIIAALKLPQSTLTAALNTRVGTAHVKVTTPLLGSTVSVI